MGAAKGCEGDDVRALERAEWRHGRVPPTGRRLLAVPATRRSRLVAGTGVGPRECEGARTTGPTNHTLQRGGARRAILRPETSLQRRAASRRSRLLSEASAAEAEALQVSGHVARRGQWRCELVPPARHRHREACTNARAEAEQRRPTTRRSEQQQQQQQQQRQQQRQQQLVELEQWFRLEVAKLVGQQQRLELVQLLELRLLELEQQLPRGRRGRWPRGRGRPWSGAGGRADSEEGTPMRSCRARW